MIKKGSFVILKRGGTVWSDRVLKVNCITKNGLKFRTYRPIDGRIWIPVDLVRLADKDEIKLGVRTH